MFKRLIKASVNSSFYLLVILFCSILSFRGVTQNLDLIIYDSLLNKFPKKNKAESKTVVVGITEKDIEKYGWPIDDIYLFEVIKNLDNYKFIFICENKKIKKYKENKKKT